MASIAQLALLLTPGIGHASARRIEEYCSAEELFSLGRESLAEVFGKHKSLIEAVSEKQAFPRAEEEMRFCEKHHIEPLYFTESRFPQRLNQSECTDSPALIYVLGTADLNAERTLSIVGTRRATPYGLDSTASIVHQTAHTGLSIVSGLAYGIDTAAHSAALEEGLPTIAALGHGLDRIYPAANRQLARRIVDSGGALLSEYPSATAINPRNFPARNRIIAALGDATLVCEASTKGGALITAAMAMSYQREVFALPGRLGDALSEGTNNLIATNQAHLLRSADDLCLHLGWPLPSGAAPSAQQGTLFPSFTPDEDNILSLLRQHSALTLDDVCTLANMPMPRTASAMFNLEMLKVVHAMPGRVYRLRQ